MTRDAGVYLLSAYRKEGKFYVVTDIKGKVTWHLIESVRSIVRISGEEMDRASAAYVTPGSPSGTTAGTMPKKNGPSPRPHVAYSGPVDPATGGPLLTPSRSSSASGPASIGTTPEGFELHVGPRGGVYHYSKNGKKVYEKR